MFTEETINKILFFGSILLLIFGLISIILAFVFWWYIPSLIILLIGGLYQCGLGLAIASAWRFIKSPIIKIRKFTWIELIILGIIAIIFGECIPYVYGLGGLGGALVAIAGIFMYLRKLGFVAPGSAVQPSAAPEIVAEEEEKKEEGEVFTTGG